MKKKLFTKDFTLVVIGQIISLFGNAAVRFALPLYLLNLTGSSALYGTVTACAFIPSILLSPVGGMIADRVNKRNIMVVLDFLTSALILGFLFFYAGNKHCPFDYGHINAFVWNCGDVSAVCSGKYPGSY